MDLIPLDKRLTIYRSNLMAVCYQISNQMTANESTCTSDRDSHAPSSARLTQSSMVIVNCVRPSLVVPL